MQDITERKQAEEALQISESKYRLLHSSMIDAFVSVDMDGRISEFNESYRKMLGYEPDELSAFTYIDLTPIKWHAFEAKIVNEEILPKGYSGIYEKEYRKKDGTVLPVELRTFLLRDEAGDPAGMWAIVRDITERKRAEEALQASELRYRNLFESMDEGFALCEMIYDESEKPVDFRYLNVNPAFARLTGLGDELVMGRTVKEAIPGIEPFWIETYGRVVQSGISERIDNSVIALGKHLEVYAWRSGVGRFAVVFSDVTERKEMEKELLRSRDELEERVRERTTELEAKNTEMERFIYTVSHDLRTPLISMSGFLGFLKQDLELGDLKRVEEDLRIANDAVTEMDRLLLETLKLSRIGRVVNPPEDLI